MPRVGFERTIPVFERAKTVHALDPATTMIGKRMKDCEARTVKNQSVVNLQTYFINDIEYY
jgi:hypothetical protein